MDRTWTVVGVGGSRRIPSSGIPGEEDQVGLGQLVRYSMDLTWTVEMGCQEHRGGRMGS